MQGVGISVRYTSRMAAGLLLHHFAWRFRHVRPCGERKNQILTMCSDVQEENMLEEIITNLRKSHTSLFVTHRLNVSARILRWVYWANLILG